MSKSLSSTDISNMPDGDILVLKRDRNAPFSRRVTVSSEVSYFNLIEHRPAPKPSEMLKLEVGCEVYSDERQRGAIVLALHDDVAWVKRNRDGGCDTWPIASCTVVSPAPRFKIGDKVVRADVEPNKRCAGEITAYTPTGVIVRWTEYSSREYRLAELLPAPLDIEVGCEVLHSLVGLRGVVIAIDLDPSRDPHNDVWVRWSATNAGTTSSASLQVIKAAPRS